MGLQIRRRSKGSKSWFNYSKSGISHSSKMGNVTTNIGPRGVRTTVNLGHGVRYVTQRGWRMRGGKFFLVELANGMYVLAILGAIAYFIKGYIL